MERKLRPQTDQQFFGMAANDRIETPPGFLSYLLNGYIEDGEVVGRSGLTRIGATSFGNDVQGIYQWGMLDGTQYTVVFADGDLHIYDWSSDTFTTHDLSAEGLTVSTTGDINCATSRGRLVFTDGVNQPIMVEGPMDGSETYTTLTNAPIAHRVGIYYAKVFFWDIPSYENEFQWSDEADPANGYAGEDQAWEFAQTDAGRIIGMAPLNERMTILKEDSATMLMGSVDENFSTLAVREGLSETEGTLAGGSVIIYEGDVYCLAVNGPRIIRQGQRYESIHEDLQKGVDYIRDIWEDVDRVYLDDAIGWVDKRRGHVGWLIPFEGDSGTMHKSLVYNARTPSWSVFDFEGFDMKAAGSVEDEDGKSWVLFGDANGKVYKYWPTAASYEDDGTAITNTFRGRLMGGDKPSTKKRLSEVHLQLDISDELEGELQVNVDGDLGHGIRFGIYDTTGRRRYRRGCNQVGYRLGWEISNSIKGQNPVLSKATSFMSIVEASTDWNG